jgi:hypothetical protein
MWIDISPKIYSCSKSSLNDAQHHESLGKYKQKLQWEIPFYLAELLKPIIEKIAMLQRNQKLCALLIGTQSGAAAEGNGLPIS